MLTAIFNRLKTHEYVPGDAHFTCYRQWQGGYIFTTAKAKWHISPEFSGEITSGETWVFLPISAISGHLSGLAVVGTDTQQSSSVKPPGGGSSHSQLSGS